MIKNKSVENNQNLSQAHEYNFNLDKFNGPLDLLLQIVKDKKIRIEDLNLLELVNQYLAMIEKLQEKNFDIATDYLVMATYLLKIKSKMFIIKDDAEETDEEIDRQELIKRLIKYEKYKQVSETFKEFYENQSLNFSKSKSNLSYIVDFKKMMEDDNEIDIGEIQINDMAKIMASVLQRQLKAKGSKTQEVQMDEVSPKEIQDKIMKLITDNEDSYSLTSLCLNQSFRVLVVTIVALLNLVMRGKITIKEVSNKDIIFKCIDKK